MLFQLLISLYCAGYCWVIILLVVVSSFPWGVALVVQVSIDMLQKLVGCSIVLAVIDLIGAVPFYFGVQVASTHGASV